jgi:hypothetical protein
MLVESDIVQRTSPQCVRPSVCPTSCSVSLRTRTRNSARFGGRPWNSCLRRAKERTATGPSSCAWPNTNESIGMKMSRSVRTMSRAAPGGRCFCASRRTSVEEYWLRASSRAYAMSGSGATRAVSAPITSRSDDSTIATASSSTVPALAIAISVMKHSGHHATAAARGGTSGSVMRNLVPSPIRLLTSMSPPCASTIP